MENSRCLFCYQYLEDDRYGFHPGCSKKMFGTTQPPEMPYSEGDMYELAQTLIRHQVSIPGEHPRLSLAISDGDNKNQPKRFTTTGVWGGYILKPPTQHFLQLPEIEDLTMHLAALAKINTVPHSLVRLQSGNLAYIAKRIDRTKKSKLHMEDMCQLTGRLTEEKYQGSYEQIAKTILKYSDNPVLDVVNFFEQIVFCFLTGNADMHLKNFSLIAQPGQGYNLAPASELIPTKLVYAEQIEEMALSLNGKKQKIRKSDFIAAFRALELSEKQQRNLFARFERILPVWLSFIDISFLNEDLKKTYKELIRQRQLQLSINL